MTEEELKKLRGYYLALLNYQQVLNEATDKSEKVIASGQFRTLANEIYQIGGNLLPVFMEDTFKLPDSDWYDIFALLQVPPAKPGEAQSFCP